jgi:hypothetical protein
MSTNAQRIRALNDAFRTSFNGGRVMMTAGIDALDGDVKAMIIRCQRRSDFPSGGRSNIPSLRTARRPPRAGAFLLSGVVCLRPCCQSAAMSVFAFRALRLDWLSL